MSLIGEKTNTGSKSLVKRDYNNQKEIATGFKKLRALDKPGSGATGIDMTALTLPSEVTSFTNPTAAELAAAKLLFFKRSVVVKSSSKGELIQDLSYRVTSNTFIEFIGFTAEENEIFEIIVDDIPATGIQVVDAQPIVSAGTLSAGTIEYNVGEPFELNKYPSRQIGAVMVFLDGVLQFRNSSNAAADPSADGNYHEKSAGSSNLGTIIEFNDVDNSNDREVVVISTIGYAERPDGSMMALIEQLQATVDVLVEDAAVGFGNNETRYQPQPTQPDLKQFGDRVFQAEQDIGSLSEGDDPANGPLQATADDYGAVKKNKWQQKILASDTTSDGDVSGLSFSNLEIGKTYRFTANIKAFVDDATNTWVLRFYDETGGTGNQLGSAFYEEIGASNIPNVTMTYSGIFTAQTTNFFSFFTSTSGSDAVKGNGTLDESNITLEELPNHEVTTDWT